MSMVEILSPQIKFKWRAIDHPRSFDGAALHHLYNGLARPADYFIIAQEWTHPHVQRAVLRLSWPAYGQRGSRCDRYGDGHGTDKAKT